MDDITRSSSVDTTLSTNDLANAFFKASQEIARQQKSARDEDPYGYLIPQNREDEFAVPHQVTFAAVWNWYLRYYYNYYDESLIDLPANSIAMRHDGFIQELLRHRQLPTVSLKHNIKCEDEDDPGQVKIRKELTRVVDALPYFQRMKLNLLEAIFYGKSGVQLAWGRKRIGGKGYLTVAKHVPVNGDKIVYDWNGNAGIMLYKGADIFQDPRASKYIEYIDKGPALFFRDDYYRDRFVIHEFEPSDTDYLFESEKALAVHGLGIRDRYYWCWNMRAELWAWMMNALQRVGANGMLYAFYQSGDPAARNATMKALLDLVQENVAAFPRNLQEQINDIIGHIEPSAVGYDVLYNIITHLEEIMRRGILGQNLSSKSAATGLGSGVADFQAGTFEDIVVYDSSCLAETLDEQLIQRIVKFNTWEYEGKNYRGDDLPFSLRFELQVDRQNVMEMIQAAQILYQMGVPLDMEDLRDKAGLSAPKTKSTTLAMPGGVSGDTTNQQAIHNETAQKPQQPQPEHFAAQPILPAISYELANVDPDMLIAGWYHPATNRVWVSMRITSTIFVIQRLANALKNIVGADNFKIVAEKDPTGDGWQEIDLSQYVVEPEWFASSAGEAWESFSSTDNCGTGYGGFKPGNTCATKDKPSEYDPGEMPSRRVPSTIKSPARPKYFGKSSARVVGGDLDTNEKLKKYLANCRKLPLHYKASDFVTLAGATDDAKVTIHRSGDQSNIKGGVIVKVNDIDTGKYYSARLFDVNGKGEKYIKNIYFFVKQTGDQGKGLGIEIFGRQIEEAVEKGFSYIKTFADRNDSQNPQLRMNGYAVWPKYGYDGEIPSRLLRLAQEQFPGAEMISDLYKSKEGREWWEKNGEGTEMVFDLRPGSQSLRVWNAYLKNRAEKGTLPTHLKETMKSLIQSGMKSEPQNENLEQFARDHSDPGVWIALRVPADLSEKLVLPDGEHSQDLHVTLAYLGRASELSPAIIETARQISEILAAHWFPLAGLIAGVGRFSASPTSDAKDVIYANVDIPSLTDFRQELIHVLKLADVPFKVNHGYTPHITLKYIDPSSPSPVERLEPFPIAFNSLSFYVGGYPQDFPFAQSSGEYIS